MRYNKIFAFNISDGPYIGVSLYTQGCPFHCKGCFNPETWDFDGGKEFNQRTVESIVSLLGKDYVRRLSILGGEPLTEEKYADIYDLLSQAVAAKNGDLWVWIWTGRKFEDILEESKTNRLLRGILDYTDYIVDGRFRLEEKDLTLRYCGSRNQRIIDVQDSILQNKAVLSDYDRRKEEKEVG